MKTKMRVFLQAGLACSMFYLGIAQADNGLKQTTVYDGIFTRTVQVKNGRGPATGDQDLTFMETTGEKYTLSKTSTKNTTIVNAVSAKASVSAAFEGVTGGLDAGWENTETRYTSTITDVTREYDYTKVDTRHYVFKKGEEAYVAVVTDSGEGFASSYFTTDPNVQQSSQNFKTKVTVDYTPVFKSFMQAIAAVRRDVTSDNTGWSHLAGVASAADMDDGTAFLTYCNQMASYSQDMDNAAWNTIAVSAANAKSEYSQGHAKNAFKVLLQGFVYVRPSKNSAQWRGLADMASTMITQIDA